MRITIDYADLTREITIWPTRVNQFRNATRQDVNTVSRNLMATIKRVMPVDTGRARATWGIFTPELIVYLTPRNPINASESIWRVEDDGLTIVQGAALAPDNYIESLNEGSSQQAPAMFLDVAAENAADELVRASEDNSNHL